MSAVKKSSSSDTRERILEAARTLFAEKGFSATSLRMITAAAGVNLGAVNYHFVSKDALIVATLSQCMGPLNARRMALLDEFEADAEGKPVSVAKILEALFRPALEMENRENETDPCRRLMGLMFSEPGDYLGPMLEEVLSDLRSRFLAAFQKSLPTLDRIDLYWYIHFAVGSYVHTVSSPHTLALYSRGHCTLTDPEDALRRLIEFCEGGLNFAAGNRANQS